MRIPIGIANSVSSNFGFDATDTLRYADHEQFELLQIYLNRRQTSDVVACRNQLKPLFTARPRGVFWHLEGGLNSELVAGDYLEQVTAVLSLVEQPAVIVHFDEKAPLDEALQIIGTLREKGYRVYLENYYQAPGAVNARKNVRKYLALFTLANSQEANLWPVLDLPRFFHRDLNLPPEEALNWCYQALNYFGNRRLPILLHLIDSHGPDQQRHSYCPVGEGYLPYRDIFGFARHNQVRFEGIILEYEDKLNPLKSRENLQEMLQS